MEISSGSRNGLCLYTIYVAATRKPSKLGNEQHSTRTDTYHNTRGILYLLESKLIKEIIDDIIYGFEVSDMMLLIKGP